VCCRLTGSYPETGFGEMSQLNVSIGADLPEADLNEAALRRTHSRVAEATVEMI
jgi:hypothetical protein